MRSGDTTAISVVYNNTLVLHTRASRETIAARLDGTAPERPPLGTTDALTMLHWVLRHPGFYGEHKDWRGESDLICLLQDHRGGNLVDPGGNVMVQLHIAEVFRDILQVAAENPEMAGFLNKLRRPAVPVTAFFVEEQKSRGRRRGKYWGGGQGRDPSKADPDGEDEPIRLGRAPRVGRGARVTETETEVHERYLKELARATRNASRRTRRRARRAPEPTETETSEPDHPDWEQGLDESQTEQGWSDTPLGQTHEDEEEEPPPESTVEDDGEITR
jgi:hypothetical protein